MRSDLSRRFEYPFVQRSAVAISVFAMALLLVSGVAIGGGTGLGAEADGPVERINGQQPQSAGVPGGGFAQMDIDPDDVLIEAAVEPDGAAVWTIEYRVRLTTDEDEQAFAELAADPSLADLRDAMRAFESADLHSSPDQLITVFGEDEPDRPQPRLDRMYANGMGICVGGLQETNTGVKYNCLAHNTIRGAAGASLLNGELLVEEGYV